ncbi:MAG: tRNA pseudouridine(55) synthase TruB [Deltaproteobacteria bacterium]|nr:tRNA pseudouridine(55) synthase TruB [Deltaproteobacteria bacterium]
MSKPGGGTPRPPDPAGILVVDKPRGPTSHDIVSSVRRFLKVKRAGHTGTLDPMAEGVLVVCLGEATKLAGHLTDTDKGYECTVRLGVSTDSHDATGEVLEERPVEVEREQVEEALEAFRGQIAQVPPMFSALKKDGRRLYELAREGETVEREPRIVTIHALELKRFEPPELDLSIQCSKGTYIRTLAHDLGEALGCGAHLSALVRSRVGAFTLEQAVSLERIKEARDPEVREALRAELLPMGEALPDWPLIRLSKRGVRDVRHGRAVGLGELAASGGGGLRPGQKVRIVDPEGDLVAIGEMKTHGLQPTRVFQAQPAP